MKFLNWKILIYTPLLICCTCSGPKSLTNSAMASSTVSEVKKSSNPNVHRYYVKGMTCGGCIFHVKSALKNNVKSIGFSEQNIEVGIANLKFNKDGYKGKQTDCAVKSTIEGKTDYTVFYDKEYKKPVCKKKS